MESAESFFRQGRLRVDPLQQGAAPPWGLWPGGGGSGRGERGGGGSGWGVWVRWGGDGPAWVGGGAARIAFPVDSPGPPLRAGPGRPASA